MIKKFFAVLIIVCFISLPFTGNTIAGNEKIVKLIPRDSLYKNGEIILKFNSSTSTSRQKQLRNLAGVKSQTLTKLSSGSKIELLKLKPGVSVKEAIDIYKSRPDVAYAEPNYLSESHFTPNDTSFGNQWGYHNTGQYIVDTTGTADADIDAPEAWDIEQGNTTPVTVAVIDSGIDTSHPDLSGKLWSNTDETAGNDIDDDGNGYVDDVNGYNFAGISQYAVNIYYTLGATASDDMAQSIKGTGQKLTSVQLYLSKIGTPTGNMTVTIRETLGGASLASATILPSEISGDTLVNKTLSSPVTLINGTTYYIQMSAPTGNSSNCYYVAANVNGYDYYESETYVEGMLHWYDGTWHNDATDDFYFKTNANAFPRDDNGHGTHVSGIVGAETNNATGVAGTSPGAKIMALKAGSSNGTLYFSDQISAINYAAANGADVINMSFGGTNFSQSRHDALVNAHNQGLTLFASAGNSGNSTVQYPAADDYVIAVGATTNQDAIASFSTYNAYTDISAPGRWVLSTMPTYAVSIDILDYAYMSGTSMASPMAAGVAALILSKYPAMTPAQVQNAMQCFANDKGAAGKDVYFGYGRINANSTLLGIASSAPTMSTLTSSTHPASTGYYRSDDPRFSWSATDNIFSISGYSYLLNQTSNSTPDTISEGAGASVTFSNKASGTWYFHVRANNSNSSWSSAWHKRINIDTYKPRTYAPRSASVTRNRYAKLYWRVTDQYTAGKATVKILIRKNGRTYKTISLGLTAIGSTRYYNYRATLARGRYKFNIYATDRAGNTQYNIASNNLTIR